MTGSQSLYMGYSKIYFGGIEQGEIIVSQAPGMVGYLSQVNICQAFFGHFEKTQAEKKLKQIFEKLKQIIQKLK